MINRLGIGILVTIALMLGVAGTVLAHDPTTPTDGVCPYGGACGGYGMGGLGYHGTMPGILAEALGMTLEELRTALADGQTIAELAATRGVKVADLVETLIAPRFESLEQAVAAGYLTQEQADWMIEEMREHMMWRLENFGLGYDGSGSGGCGMRGGGIYGGSGGMGGGGWGGNQGHRGGMGGGHWGGNNTSRFPAWAAPSDDL